MSNVGFLVAAGVIIYYFEFFSVLAYNEQISRFYGMGFALSVGLVLEWEGCLY